MAARAFDAITGAGYSVAVESEPPPSAGRNDQERERRRLERVLPLLIKRLLESGYEKLSEGPENLRQFLSELKLPKEALALLLAQADETKNGLYRVVAREIRDFLDHTNFADEFVKALTAVSFEIKTEVRFVPNQSRLGASPDVRAQVRVKRPDDRKSAPPSPPSEPPRAKRPAEQQSAPPPVPPESEQPEVREEPNG